MIGYGRTPTTPHIDGTRNMATASHTSDIGSARSALHAIPPDLPREDWVRAVMAAQAAGLSREDVEEWSAGGASFDARSFSDVWRSCDPGGKIGAGTLFRMAVASGWKRGRSVHTTPAASARRATRSQERTKAHSPGPGAAAQVWQRLSPATAEHGYIIAKDGMPDGLRVVPDGDPLRIAGLSMVGALAVPVEPLVGGEPVSIQFIAPPELAAQWKADGRPGKLNLPGAKVEGAHIVSDDGSLPPGGTAYVVEGIGQAWACWKATGHPAVVAFGWGRVRAVAEELRQRDASARLVLVPDAGKEDDAEKIAAELGAELVTMPEGSPPNFDANDYAKEHGHDALEVLLGQAQRPPEPEPHPLARFIELAADPVPQRMVIPGFVQAGVAVIAGAHGAGKTTVLVPLAMIAAGLHPPGDPLAPKHWRHVVYIAEDEAQVQRIVRGVIDHAHVGAGLAAARDRFHVVPACRLPPEDVAAVGPTYREQFTRLADGVQLPPLVVIDTKGATVEVEDENDNAEAGRMVAIFKQQFAGLPLWLVGHLPKSLTARKDAQALSARGASAIEADAHQCLYLVAEDDGRRFLVLGKRRFEPRWTELEVRSGTAEVTALDEWGESVPLVLRWGWPAPPQTSRAEAAEHAKSIEATAARTAMRTAILDAVEAGEREGNPLSRRGVEDRVSGRHAEVRACIAVLMDELWLWPVTVPSKVRVNPNRSEFLVRLSDAERRALLEGHELPGDRLAVPASWCKAVAPQPGATTPETEAEC